jgi:hypothetical protein
MRVKVFELARDRSARRTILKRPLLWIAIGGGVAATVFLTRKKANAAPLVPNEPQSYGETKCVPLAIPIGWRRVTGAEVAALPELQTWASGLRSTPGFTSTPYGTLSSFVASDGKTYATWVEQHYHEPGGPVKPWGLHHGVTILARATAS